MRPIPLLSDALSTPQPFLYQTAAALNDITAGSNGGCGFSVSDRGFYAVAGWDPVTGLGTPNFAALSKAVEALP